MTGTGKTKMRNQVDFAKSTSNIYNASPYNVFSLTNYQKEQKYKPRHLILVIKMLNDVKLFTVVQLAKSTLYNID